MFDVYFYRLSNGIAPVEEFLDSLDPAMRAKALSGISLLKDRGNMLREPYSTYIDKGIFELRIKTAGNISRIFYFFRQGKCIMLTNGYMKKSQKMDNKEYERALSYKLDYEKRHERGNERG
jgi:phage-related protein